MAKKTSPLKDLLKEDFMQKALSELGLQDNSPEDQATLMEMLGENILKRLTLEILTVLPANERGTFEQLVGGENGQELQAFLTKHIPDFENFVETYAEQEFEATKSRIHSLKQSLV